MSLFPEWEAKMLNHPRYANKNPMVVKFGLTEGKTCGECKHLITVKEFTKKYFKCPLRGNTRSTATDHRKGWDACKRFEGVA